MLRVVASLTELRSPHAITGLCAWVQEESGRSLAWMASCLPAAEAR